MAPFPLNLTELLGHWPSYIVYLVIGFAFGYVLEIAGFGNSSKLAAQFYFKEMTVLKVMFGAIIVAMVLIFGATGLGLLDYNLIYVNPTYLWPGIIGGLIMGFGFIIGGFCPGTSLVSAATAKLDGIMFVLGVFLGIFLFGETVGLYEDFWYSSYMGRFTLMDLFNTGVGPIVVVVVIAAILAFLGAEMAEKYIGKMPLAQFGRWRYSAAAGIIVLAFVVLFIGQPTNADKWARMADEQETRIENREIYIHPGEILHLMEDPKITVKMIDVRSETDYNIFHVLDAKHIPADQIQSYVGEFNLEPANTVFMLMSNDEETATEAWRTLIAESVPNVYVLEGGVNNWVSIFSDKEFVTSAQVPDHAADTLAFAFPSALGSRSPAADPNPDVYELEYESKVVLELKRGPASGGCG
ncbi:YeeE/YedE family protein [Phototrophicus methaneseepsis]|uniref:YeeE/YedE family protein n=1 Tax=Phototrophicus methaneseepsis TaxID=2710758 RepID=A0A7S8IDA3_9CHLR|nr:YeeE/YedE thiosulfate transporter family protein [Phototrophicus methaneseepsis]QPC81357.1 YeeE/YedE family protein [Phototrophicus methaneseepsis]